MSVERAVWNPLKAPVEGLSGAKAAVVILNQPLPIKEGYFHKIWTHAAMRACADGGTNRLYDETGDELRERYLPDFIVGDLDSLREDVRQYYASKGVDIVHRPCQNAHDLSKAITHLVEEGAKKGIEWEYIYVIGGLGGRFDQTMATINTLFRHTGSWYQLCLVSAESLVVLLPPGKHTVQINPWEGPTCGLIPVGLECRSLTTTGLRWNLENTPSFFGGMVSSSNAPEGDTVTIENSDNLIWTVELQPLK
eukprot:Colp12_sorted_trinity150504_noHs@23038